MTLRVAIDRPEIDAIVQRHGFAVDGWALLPGEIPLREVIAEASGARLGATRHTFIRGDVNAVFGLKADTRTGFSISCTVPEALRTLPGLDVVLRATTVDGSQVELGARRVTFSAYDYRLSGHGHILTDAFDRVMARDEIYASGPPSPLADPQCVELIARYANPGSRVIDVGCGIGAYGFALRDRGFIWTGCEVRDDFVQHARQNGLDSRLVTDGRLPFPDQSFDVAIAVEVLEHVPDFESLAYELRRVAPLALLSVPNFEAIPVTSSFYALPWHMLEPDHRNFFSRASLKATLLKRFRHVEVVEYGPLPLLRAQDGLPVYNHLFAIANA